MRPMNRSQFKAMTRTGFENALHFGICAFLIPIALSFNFTLLYVPPAWICGFLIGCAQWAWGNPRCATLPKGE